MAATFGFLESFSQSLLRPAFYREVAGQPLGRSFLYFMGLILLSTLVVGLKMDLAMYGEVQQVAAWLKEELPTVVIQDGRVARVDAPEPVRLERGKLYVIHIDTTGRITHIDPEFPAGLLITQSQLHLKFSPEQTRIYALSNVGDLTVDAMAVENWAAAFLVILLPLMFVFLLLYFAAAKLIHALIFSPLAMWLSRATGNPRPFREIYAMALYALTPAVFLDTVLVALNWGGSWSWGLYGAVYLTYLGLGVAQGEERG